MTKKAFIFPGQGSQAVGMGKALFDAFPQAKAVFEEVDSALGQKLSHLIFEGPIETLTLTSNAQPALMTVSMAVMRVLEAEADLNLSKDVTCVAGHSLGEYSALAAVGALSIGDAARLLRIRGDAMQKAVDEVTAEGYSAQLLLSAILPKVAKDKILTERVKAEIAIRMAEAEKNMIEGADEYLQLMTVCTLAIQWFETSRHERAKTN